MSQAKTRTIATARIEHQITEQGQGPLVLLLHGFPESAYSWRHQLGALAAAGYHAVAPNQRGYAGSGRPQPVEAYDIIELTSDMVALLDALGERQCVVVGHDWGAPVAWNLALLHPDRVRAVVGMSVPYGGRPLSSPIARMRELFKDIFFYMVYFQDEGVAEAELDADVRRSLLAFYVSASGDAPPGAAFSPKPKSAKLLDTMSDSQVLPSWLSPADLDVFTREFTQSGFRGPINWYRNFDRSWERTAQLADARIEQPALFIAGERDAVIAWSASQLKRMPTIMPKLRETLMLPGCGHWVQQERPTEVNAALLRFLSEIK
jgi:pimeloyl-ACP methyl ester carboxylesterase